MRKWKYIHLFLTLALDGDDWLASRVGRFAPRISAPGTYCIVDSHSRLGCCAEEVSLIPLRGIEPRMVGFQVRN